MNSSCLIQKKLGVFTYQHESLEFSGISGNTTRSSLMCFSLYEVSTSEKHLRKQEEAVQEHRPLCAGFCLHNFQASLASQVFIPAKYHLPFYQATSRETPYVCSRKTSHNTGTRNPHCTVWVRGLKRLLCKMKDMIKF